MIIDGRQIAKEIIEALTQATSAHRTRPHVTIYASEPNFATRKYLELKQKKAREAGVEVSLIEFKDTVTTEEICDSIANQLSVTDGIIVQLPLPKHVDSDQILSSIPLSHDVDGMHYDGTDATPLSPVVGAIAEIAKRHDVSFAGKQVVVVGQGRLVGQPAAVYARASGAHVAVLTKQADDSAEVVTSADILILGAGVPHLITPDMVKPGVVIFDAGTSEAGGVLVGDAHPDCAEKAALFTPVPGGIGPITVAVLLRNVVELANKKTRSSMDGLSQN